MNEHELRIIIYHRCIRGDIIKNIITNKYQSKSEARHELERYFYKIWKGVNNFLQQQRCCLWIEFEFDNE